MIASARRSSSFARYRFAMLPGAPAVSVNGYAVCAMSSPNTARHAGIERKPLCAIALAVLGLHGLVAIEVFHAFDSGAPTSEPVALDVQLNAFSAPQAPALGAPARQPTPGRNPAQVARTPPSPSVLPHLHRSTAVPVRRASTLAATQPSSTAHEPANAPSGVGDGSAAPSASPIAPEHGAGTVTPNAQASASVADSGDIAAQPITAPSFNAAYLHNPPPAYPAIAQQRAWEGTVLLKVHVLASGKPDQIEIVSSSGHPPLDDAAKEAVTDWSFLPARRATQAVDGWVQVPIEFKLGT
jgi:periplasmic protein TonB